MMNEVSQSSNPGSIAWDTYPLLRISVRFAAWIWRWNSDRAGQRPLLGRFASHISVGLMLALILFAAGLQVEALVTASEAADMVLLGNQAQAMNVISAPTRRVYYHGGMQSAIVRQAQSHTAIPDRPRLEIITYEVQAGDTAETIAANFNLQPTTLLWSNPEMEKVPDLLKVGQMLVILPLDGVYHTIAVSETLEILAEKYKVEVDTIVNCSFNIISRNRELVVGEKLIIPGGQKPYEVRKVTTYEGPVVEDVAGSGAFYWPASGVLTQGYWYAHRAIDIGSSVGTAIIASDTGYVSFAGWTDIGYGYLIVVNHANGYQTYYAHLSNIFVSEGEMVYGGQVIGAMGSTGNSTGPHLHFEIRYNGYPTNPRIYLP